MCLMVSMKTLETLKPISASNQIAREIHDSRRHAQHAAWERYAGGVRSLGIYQWCVDLQSPFY